MPEPHTAESILAEFTFADGSLRGLTLARYAALWRNEAADSEAIAVTLQKDLDRLITADRERLSAIVRRVREVLDTAAYDVRDGYGNIHAKNVVDVGLVLHALEESS